MAKGLTSRRRWYVGLVLGLTLGALTFAAFANASAKRPPVATTAASLEQTTNCLTLFPTSTIASITEIGAKVYYHTFFKSTEGDPAFDYASTGRIAGWACSWLAVKPPWGDANLVQNTAFVSAGYGETEANWKKLKPITGPVLYLNPLAVQSGGGTLKLGHGSQAFLVIEDLWAYDSLTSDDGNPRSSPHYLYVISALSRHHDALQIAFDNASLAKTKVEAKRILKGGSF